MSVKGTQGDSQRCWLLLRWILFWKSLQSKLMILPRFPQFPPSPLPHLSWYSPSYCFFPQPLQHMKIMASLGSQHRFGWNVVWRVVLSVTYCDLYSRFDRKLYFTYLRWAQPLYQLMMPIPHIRCAKEVKSWKEPLCVVWWQSSPQSAESCCHSETFGAIIVFLNEDIDPGELSLHM